VKLAIARAGENADFTRLRDIGLGDVLAGCPFND